MTSEHQPSLLYLLGFISAGESHSRWAALGIVENTTENPYSDTFLFSLFILNQAVPDGTFPLSVWICLEYSCVPKNLSKNNGKSHDLGTAVFCSSLLMQTGTSANDCAVFSLPCLCILNQTLWNLTIIDRMEG